MFVAVAAKGPVSTKVQESVVAPSFKVKVKVTLGMVLLTGAVVVTVPVPVMTCVVGVADPVGVHATEVKVSALNVKLWVGFVV